MILYTHRIEYSSHLGEPSRRVEDKPWLVRRRNGAILLLLSAICAEHLSDGMDAVRVL